MELNERWLKEFKMFNKGERMNFPDTFDEFAKYYQIIDKDEHYSNGIEFIPVFRVKQWLEHLQELKVGHWNTFEQFQGGIKEIWYECSECKWHNALSLPRNYCPNCGCRME